MITADANAALRAADFARKGSMPFGRGWMNESSSTMKAIQFVWMLEDPIRAKAGLTD